MQWSTFWEHIRSAVHDNPQLESTQKLTYLREAIKDSTASPLIFRTSVTPNQYEDLLKERYDQKPQYPHIGHHRMSTTQEWEPWGTMLLHQHTGAQLLSLKDSSQYDVGPVF